MESKDIESKDWAYHKLSPIRKWKLSEFFENLVNKISIVYSNKDFQDIQIAVEKSLQKVVAKMNKRVAFFEFLEFSHVEAWLRKHPFGSGEGGKKNIILS